MTSGCHPGFPARQCGVAEREGPVNVGAGLVAEEVRSGCSGLSWPSWRPG